MGYLYGDATPFPFAHNFIETLGAAIDMCVALFRADVVAEDGRRRADEMKTQCQRELSKLSELSKALEGALRPAVGTGESISESTATRVCELAASTIKQSQLTLTARRDQAEQLTMSEQAGADSTAAVAMFFTSFEMPKTAWQIAWQWQNSGATATASFHTEFGLTATFSSSIAASHAWARPVRVGTLVPRLTLEIPTRGRKRKPRVHRLPLHRLHIVSATLTDKQFSVRVGKSATKPSPGYELVFRGDDQAFATVTPMDATGETTGPAITIPDTAAVAIESLADLVEAALNGFRDRRDCLRSAEYEGTRVGDLADPGALAQVMLMTLARATAADTNIKAIEVERVQEVLKEHTGEDFPTADVRVAAQSRMFESAPLEKYLTSSAKRMATTDRVSTAQALAEVINADGRVSDREVTFYNLVVESLALTPAQLMGITAD